MMTCQHSAWHIYEVMLSSSTLPMYEYVLDETMGHSSTDSRHNKAKQLYNSSIWPILESGVVKGSG